MLQIVRIKRIYLNTQVYITGYQYIDFKTEEFIKLLIHTEYGLN